ncbi:hypothetical protein BEP19_02955 [Ammoniphilus oxalaticus]|uniref:Uncharacterized protein n=1 Tax=Ammoniphilus oxalaticus TaxID=66863 RepID=A0A419SNR8_9BACL|nr:hypothetical protein [Ammoniphilus oxalaticus]RKD25903.1 hypothetical protein BEP19_02955 [Ammoniphilus oxalaticus]
MKNKHLAIGFIILLTVIFYSWIIYFADLSSTRAIGGTFFPIIGGVVALSWMVRNNCLSSGSNNLFWLLLKIGMTTHLVSSLCWFVNQLVGGISEYSKMFHVMWLATYICFLIA